MPKIPSLKPKEVIRKFERAGFVRDRQKGSHIILYHVGKKKRIVVPMHVRDLPRGTLLAIIKQSGLTRGAFIKL